MSKPSGLMLLLVLLAGACLGAIPAYYFAQIGKGSFLSELPPSTLPVTRITARGRLEPAGGIIHVSALLPDRLAILRVKEGDEVKEGQELAVLGSQPLRALECKLARTQLQEADERLTKSIAHLQLQIKETEQRSDQLKKQGDLDVEVQQTKVKIVKKQLDAAEDLLRRLKQVGSYTAQEIGQQELAVHQAREEHAGAVAVLRKIESANESNLKAAAAERETALASLEKSKAEFPRASLTQNIELADERLKLTILLAPARGRVLKVLAREGELVGASPIFQLADSSSMVAVAEVYETDIKMLRNWHQESQPVPAVIKARFTRGQSREFSGTVERIGTLVKKNSLFSLDPREDLDCRVFEVRIRLDGKDAEEAAQYIHMQADVVIPNPQSP